MVIEIELSDYEFLDENTTEKVGTLKVHIDANTEELETVCEKLKLNKENLDTNNIKENNQEDNNCTGLTKRERTFRDILNYIRQHKTVTTFDMAPVFDMTRENLTVYLRQLRDSGKIKKVGYGATTQWVIGEQ